ncbi:O-methyltransferase 1, chloroplastic-like isoform X1 [Salvia splendens]|uniref:O-methyltransferase 1, chloroplastic-like isoform X1 n=1 Tax=Salvia splendens TaxID=180675 RepID=UPI0011001B5D|nr:O-methyltransferase 1, chloroplastic-like isoform X1 [Salvia splendens]
MKLLAMSSCLPRPTPYLFLASKKTAKPILNCKFNNAEAHEFFQAALHRASLRFQETLRPGMLYPLFTDPYIRCLLPLDIEMDVNQSLHKHCLATKFIDDKLITSMQKDDGLRQIIFLTDGMDTRPYRLNWPASTVLFDISPDIIFRQSIQKLEEVGAKIPRRCLLLHVPSETSDIQEALRSKGYNGTRSSLWVLQGLPVVTLSNFQDILSIVSALAMKGSFIIGELPSWLVKTETDTKSTTAEWMDKLFVSHGLKVEIVERDEVARDLGNESSFGDCEMILFAAEQLQFSDDQMELWRREFQRIEEEGDEDGFEEL